MLSINRMCCIDNFKALLERRGKFDEDHSMVHSSMNEARVKQKRLKEGLAVRAVERPELGRWALGGFVQSVPYRSSYMAIVPHI